jgi:hypothetical protein
MLRNGDIGLFKPQRRAQFPHNAIVVIYAHQQITIRRMPMPMPKAKPLHLHRTMTGLRLPPELLTELDTYCRDQKYPPSRTAVLELALREFLAREGTAKVVQRQAVASQSMSVASPLASASP